MSIAESVEQTKGAARARGGDPGERTMNLTLNVWRQKNRHTEGAFVTYQAVGISPDATRAPAAPDAAAESDADRDRKTFVIGTGRIHVA